MSKTFTGSESLKTTSDPIPKRHEESASATTTSDPAPATQTTTTAGDSDGAK